MGSVLFEMLPVCLPVCHLFGNRGSSSLNGNAISDKGIDSFAEKIAELPSLSDLS